MKALTLKEAETKAREEAQVMSTLPSQGCALNVRTRLPRRLENSPWPKPPKLHSRSGHKDSSELHQYVPEVSGCWELKLPDVQCRFPPFSCSLNISVSDTNDRRPDVWIVNAARDRALSRHM